jgi:hypothetical protein
MYGQRPIMYYSNGVQGRPSVLQNNLEKFMDSTQRPSCKHHVPSHQKMATPIDTKLQERTYQRGLLKVSQNDLPVLH